MNRYRKIDPRFWKDEKIVTFSPEEKLVALYLFTGQSNRIGIFSFSPGEAAEDTGTLPPTFTERFRKVCQTLNIGWDETFRVLYIPTWWKYNPPENSNNVIGNLKDLDDVPNSSLINLFINNLEYLPESLRETFTETLTKRYPQRYPKRSPSQEQEQEYKSTESDKPIPDSVSRNGDPKSAVDKQLLSDPTNLPPSSKKKKTVPRRAGIPPELQPAVSRIVGRINELGGTRYRDDTPDALRNLITRLNEGRTEAECLAVVESRCAAWTGNDKMLEYFRPSTLFAAVHFEDYLQATQRQSNGHAAAKVEFLDNDRVKVDGFTMSRADYERKNAKRQRDA
jgi:uncharacterized phage protein (TIGR02220 family)